MMYNAQHNVCLYSGAEITPALFHVDGAKYLDDAGVMAIPRELGAMQQVTRLRLPAVSPIISEYDWPSNKAKVPAPFAHQKIMASFLTLNPRAFNLSDIGTGKTLGTLWAFEYLKRKGVLHKAVVLSPLSTVRRVWEDEITHHFLGRLKCAILHGSEAKRLERLKEDVDVYIINHDGLGVGKTRSESGRLQLGELAAAIASRPDIDLIIVDEGSVFKDPGTNRYKLLRQMVKDKRWIWWMTGTPTPNKPTDAWSQARVVRTDYTESLHNMQEKTMTKVSQFKWVPRKDAHNYVSRVLTPALRFHREDCLDLPPLTLSTLEVELSDAQKKAYEELRKTLRTQIEGGGQISAVNEAALRTKLIQVACGAVYGAHHTINRVDCLPRLRVLDEIIEQTEGKLLIFAPLLSVSALLAEELAKAGHTVAKIDGETSQGVRNQAFLDFQTKPDPRIIVAHPGTMAHGLTLTAAATVVWYGPIDQPEIYTQANGRINRPGQTKSMHVIRLTATAIEREIFKRLDGKESMQSLILDIIKREE